MARTGSTRLSVRRSAKTSGTAGAASSKAASSKASVRTSGQTSPGRPTGGSSLRSPGWARRSGATARGASGALPGGAAKQGRLSQLRQAYRVTKVGDPRIGLILLATFVFASLVGYALMSLIPPGWLILDVLFGLLLGLAVAMIVFARRAQKSQLNQLEGKPGAALAALSLLRRGWRTEQAVAFNRNQDVVHRVVGPPGIVLIGEGNPHRIKALLGTERTRHQRVVTDTPIHSVVVGYGEGEVPLSKLTRHLTKMKRQVQPAQITDIMARLKALDASRSTVPVPKGPMPTSMKGQRGQLRGR